MILNINIVVILKFNIRQKFCVAHMQPLQKKKKKTKTRDIQTIQHGNWEDSNEQSSRWQKENKRALAFCYMPHFYTYTYIFAFYIYHINSAESLSSKVYLCKCEAMCRWDRKKTTHTLQRTLVWFFLFIWKKSHIVWFAYIHYINFAVILRSVYIVQQHKIKEWRYLNTNIIFFDDFYVVVVLF